MRRDEYLFTSENGSFVKIIANVNLDGVSFAFVHLLHPNVLNFHVFSTVFFCVLL